MQRNIRNKRIREIRLAPTGSCKKLLSSKYRGLSDPLSLQQKTLKGPLKFRGWNACTISDGKSLARYTLFSHARHRHPFSLALLRPRAVCFVRKKQLLLQVTKCNYLNQFLNHFCMLQMIFLSLSRCTSWSRTLRQEKTISNVGQKM